MERSLAWEDRPRRHEASHGPDAFLTVACSNVPDEDEMLKRNDWERLRRQGPLRGIV